MDDYEFEELWLAQEAVAEGVQPRDGFAIVAATYMFASGFARQFRELACASYNLRLGNPAHLAAEDGEVWESYWIEVSVGSSEHESALHNARVDMRLQEG